MDQLTCFNPRNIKQIVNQYHQVVKPTAAPLEQISLLVVDCAGEALEYRPQATLRDGERGTNVVDHCTQEADETPLFFPEADYLL
jgi:hypothetical protein